MKWLELRDLMAGHYIFLFACPPSRSAWEFKKKIKELRPNSVILYAGPVSKIREYQASHWVQSHGDYQYHNYLVSQKLLSQRPSTALESLKTALQQIEKESNFTPSEIVLVRAKKLRKT